MLPALIQRWLERWTGPMERDLRAILGLVRWLLVVVLVLLVVMGAVAVVQEVVGLVLWWRGLSSRDVGMVHVHDAPVPNFGATLVRGVLVG